VIVFRPPRLLLQGKTTQQWLSLVFAVQLAS